MKTKLKSISEEKELTEYLNELIDEFGWELFRDWVESLEPELRHEAYLLVKERR